VDIQAYIQSGAIESYVLGMADAEEAAELEQLSLQYPGVKQVVAAFEALLEQQAQQAAVAPPASVKENIMQALQSEFTTFNTFVPAATTTAPVKEMHATPQQAPVRKMENNWIKYTAVAAVFLLVASTGLNVYLYKQAKTVKSDYLALLKQNASVTADNRVYQTKMMELTNSIEMMSNPAMVKVPMNGVKEKEELATVYWDSNTKDVYLWANNLPATPEDKQYQLWALVDGVPVDAGVLEADCNGLCKLSNIKKAQAFAITLEKKGGSPKPDLTQLHVMGKVG
jgi:anti-sigma-K factor RskA